MLGGGGTKSLNFRGGEIPKGGRDPPGRAISLGISPRGGADPLEGRNPCDTGSHFSKKRSKRLDGDKITKLEKLLYTKKIYISSNI